MTRPKLLGVGGAHIDRRGQWLPLSPGASNPPDARDGGGGAQCTAQCAQRGVDCAPCRCAAPIGRRQCPAPSTTRRSAICHPCSRPGDGEHTAIVDLDGRWPGWLTWSRRNVFAKQLRRSKARDEIADADAILCDANLPAAGPSGLGHRPAALCHRHFARQGRAVCGRAGERRLPVHERPRGGRPLGDAARSRPGRACQAAARGRPARGRHHGGRHGYIRLRRRRHLFDRTARAAICVRRNRRPRCAGRRHGCGDDARQAAPRGPA